MASMNLPNSTHGRSAPARGPVRRVAAAIVLSALVFVLLWVVAFNLVTSLLIAAGFGVVVVVASVVADPVETVLDAIAALVFGVLAAIAALFGAIFALLGF